MVVNVVALALGAAVRAVTGPESLLPIVLALPVAIYWAVGVWRCAYNCKSHALGTYIRVCIVASIVGFTLFGVAALHGK